MSSDDVTVREDSAIPFAIVPKTQQQRLKIARAVLGPPTGFDRGRLLQLREDICGIGLTFVSFVLLLVFFSIINFGLWECRSRIDEDIERSLRDPISPRCFCRSDRTEHWANIGGDGEEITANSKSICDCCDFESNAPTFSN
jgi:hypothetical protein